MYIQFGKLHFHNWVTLKSTFLNTHKKCHTLVRQNFVFRKKTYFPTAHHIYPLLIFIFIFKKRIDENYRIVELLFWESTVNNIDNALRESKEQGSMMILCLVPQNNHILYFRIRSCYLQCQWRLCNISWYHHFPLPSRSRGKHQILLKGTKKNVP